MDDRDDLSTPDSIFVPSIRRTVRPLDPAGCALVPWSWQTDSVVLETVESIHRRSGNEVVFDAWLIPDTDETGSDGIGLYVAGHRVGSVRSSQLPALRPRYLDMLETGGRFVHGLVGLDLEGYEEPYGIAGIDPEMYVPVHFGVLPYGEPPEGDYADAARNVVFSRDFLRVAKPAADLPEFQEHARTVVQAVAPLLWGIRDLPSDPSAIPTFTETDWSTVECAVQGVINAAECSMWVDEVGEVDGALDTALEELSRALDYGAL